MVPPLAVEAGRLRPDLPRILDHLARFTADPIAADPVIRLVRNDLDDLRLIERYGIQTHSADRLGDPRIARCREGA